MSVSSVAVNDSSIAGSSCSLSPYPVLLCVLFFFLAPPVSLCARTHMHATDFVILTLRTFVYVCVCVCVYSRSGKMAWQALRTCHQLLYSHPAA